MAVQDSRFERCLSLFLPLEGGRDATCMRCEQVGDLMNMMAELKEKVKRLRSIRKNKQEIDWHTY